MSLYGFKLFQGLDLSFLWVSMLFHAKPNTPMKSLNLKKTALLFFVFFLGASMLYASKDPIKYGKVSIEELAMTSYEKDTTAVAVYLCDFGISNIEFNTVSGQFQFTFTRTLRIKILKDEGLEYATLEVGYMKDFQRINVIKGCTYNLVNGNVEKTKLNPDDKLLEKTSDDLNTYKLTLPNVKKGSVIEFMYQISSDGSIHLPTWYFQHDIPVIWSEYLASTPEFFDFNKTSKGYLSFDVNEHNYKSAVVGEKSFSINMYRYVVKDAPAFKKEPFTTTSKNFKSAIEFELTGYRTINGIYYDQIGTWEKINEKLMKSDYFGMQLNGGGFLKEVVEEISTKASSEEDKMTAAFNYIKNNMKWNELNGKYTTTTLREAFKEKKGNVADINLMLVVLLNKLGINSDPIILSTRDNGMLNLIFPTSSKFNYVIAQVRIGDKTFLLDATEPNCPCNVLPLRCINDKGRLISKTGTHWVDIAANTISKTMAIAKLELNEEGEVAGNLQFAYSGNAALEFRAEMKDKSKDQILEKLQQDYKNLSIESIELDNLKKVEETLKSNLEIELSEEAEGNGDLIYFNPFIVDRTSSNPFTLEERKYPVDYGYLIDKVFLLELKLPEGYSLETKPAAARIKLPEDSGAYMYSVTENGSTVLINCRFKINKRQFLFNEYAILKEFYNLIVAKEAEMLVIKKKS